MAGRERPATPPARSSDSNMVASHPPITPEQVRRMEENRLRAKARRQQEEAAAAAAADARKNRMTRAQAAAAAGTKRNFSSISSERVPSTSRDARNAPPAGSSASQAPDSVNVLASTADTSIRPARKFQKYVEYDFSKMTDTKGGFMTQEDDPFNKVLHAPEETGKPANMTLKEWEQLQLQKRLRDHRQGPYEPGLSILDRRNAKKCRECGSMEIDWQWDELLGCQVCQGCKDKFPEKYSLLTKTEAKEDYLLTDPELRDEKLLPHLIKPNPHKSSWNNMMLYLRFQIEEYAFSARKWGSAEALDEEFARRTQEAKDRKEKKFQNKLNELKKRTRVEAYKRARGGGGGEFGDTIGTGRHEHEWGRPVEDPETGMTKKACVECGMEVEELEF